MYTILVSSKFFFKLSIIMKMDEFRGKLFNYILLFLIKDWFIYIVDMEAIKIYK